MPGVKAESWTYASGRTAALEGALLRREALERLAEAASRAAMTAALSECPVQAAVAAARTPHEAAEAVAAHYAGRVADLRGSCPDPAAFALLELPGRYERIKESARAALKSADRAAALREISADGRAAEALDLLAAILTEPGGPGPELAAELLLDSARLLETGELGARLDSPAVAGHAADEVKIRTALVLWRSHLVADAQGEDSALGRWLPRLFLRGGLAAGRIADLWGEELATWGLEIELEFGPELGGEVFRAGEPEQLSGWERAAFNWLTHRAREFRSVAFGVERVYGYAWGLAVEERNVRLAVIGRLRGVEPAAIRELLWEPYCL